MALPLTAGENSKRRFWGDYVPQLHQAIGRSRGGITTKILALTDSSGNLADFRLLPGQAHDLRGVPGLIDGLEAEHLLANRAFDADWLRDALSEHDIAPVIPPRKTRTLPQPMTKRCANGGIWSRTSSRRLKIAEA